MTQGLGHYWRVWRFGSDAYLKNRKLYVSKVKAWNRQWSLPRKIGVLEQKKLKNPKSECRNLQYETWYQDLPQYEHHRKKKFLDIEILTLIFQKLSIL